MHHSSDNQPLISRSARRAAHHFLLIPVVPLVVLKLVRHAVAAIGLGALPHALPHSAAKSVPSVISHDAPQRRVAESSAHGGVPVGSYVAVQANGQKLPWTTKVPAVEGLVHWARLDLAVLRLTADGHFTLSYRYAQDVLDPRQPVHLPPARDELSTGRYSERGKTLTFVPTPTKGKAARTVTADVVGPDIYLDKTVFVGEKPFRVRLLFRRDPSLW